MKLRELTVAGFGRLSGRTFAFGDGLNVVYGPNEAGKSTLAAAIVASLYGTGRRKEAWRPWNGGAYATTLVYELADGRSFEVRRDYARDAKGVHVYDRDGNDVAGDVALGRTISPGEVHLQLPYDAFVNASCVLQQHVGIDADRNAPIATALARALDGGPKEDAALGALRRLEDARKTYVGTARSTVNNPLKTLRDEIARRAAAAGAARSARDALAQLRERRAATIAARDRLTERRAGAERELKALQAAELRARLEQLRVYRDDFAALQAERARYDDVAGFPAERCGELDAAFYAWRAAADAAASAEREAATAQPTALERAELDARRADAGALDELTFRALHDAAGQAAAARAVAAAAANDAAAARREGNGGRALAGLALAAGAACAAIAVALAIAHWWPDAELFAAVAALTLGAAGWRGRNRLRTVRAAARKQRVADDALESERSASAAVAAVLERIGVPNIEELSRRRARLAELLRNLAAAERAAARANESRGVETRAAAAFDALANDLVPHASGSRAERCAAAADCARRRRKRDGLDNGIAMLALQRSEILRDDDEFALVAERDALAHAGIAPAEAYGRTLRDAAVAKIAEFDRAIRDAELAVATLTAELKLGEHAVPELAPLEEDLARRHAELGALEAFDRALALAAATVERLTGEAHQAFARRLETYAAAALLDVTGGRYGEIRVDPKTLIVRARVPETGLIVELDALSAGTRDQIYLIVRIAMARMFAEGLELPPLLLDDPFAYWDDARIERCLPIVARNAFEAQTILFTASPELAATAERRGAQRIDLLASVPA